MSASSQLDLTPRIVNESVPRVRSRRVLPYAVVALVVIAFGFVLFNLREATVFFLNVDEAVARRDDMVGKHLRIQGKFVPESLVHSDKGVTFNLAYGDAVVSVRHLGDTPAMFQPGIPVVLEGMWDRDVFQSERILVKHDAEYEARNPERLR